MLTIFADDNSVLSAIRAGASEYLFKYADQDELLRATQKLAAFGLIFIVVCYNRCKLEESF